ncbi:MAG: response regulator, partial [Terrimicrobiaceae bacterium]|nr:response regulator [Terrimicrobiaceae bacterium]
MRILIADPDLAHASSLSEWLAAHGWPQPGIASTTNEAFEWINLKGGLEVLICEVGLEHKDGPTTREALLEFLPDLKTIFFSAADCS